MLSDIEFSDMLSRICRGALSPVAHGASANQRTADALRQRIISLDLPPDTVLSRTALAEEYGVSQTPLREALLKLESEGLVDIYPQSKTVVTRIDTDRMDEAHFLRLSVEVAVARQLAEQGASKAIDRLKTIIALQEALGTSADIVPVFQDMDESFHQTMLDAVGHPSLYGLIQSMSGQVNRIRRLDKPDPSKIGRILDGHRDIVDGIATGNADQAEAAIRDHLSQTISRVAMLKDQHPDYFKA